MATGVQMRDMYDAEGARNNIYAGALDALSKRFPVEDDDYKLELINPHYSGPQDFTLTQQKKALMHNRRLTTPITGTWRLTHKPTNKVLDERKDVVMSIPYYTQRGTFINNGNDYSIVSQARLMPGAYIRRQRTGEVEAQFNVEPGSGRGMRLHLQPETGEFKVGIGSAHIPLYSLLNAMGVEDKELMKLWGADLLAENMRKHNSQNLSKLYQRLAGYKADANADENAMRSYLRDELPKYKLDPAVVARTLGIENAEGISKEVLLRATQKMLNVSRGEEETDDRDSTQFARVYGVEDLVRERIDKDAGQLTRNLLWRIRRSRNLKPVQYGALNPYVDSLILGSGLAMPLEETNPLSTLEQMTRITKLGEGGIGSAEAITDEARDVNPSQFGFIDPIAGPEGLNIGIDVRTAHGVMKGADNKLYQQVVDARSGKTKYISPDIAVNSVLAYPGQDLKQREVYAMKDGKVQAVPSKDVDYQLPSFSNMFSANTNLNPMPTAVQPGRQFYGLKFWSQYLPQRKGEVPLVDTVMDDGKTTFSELYGRKVGTLQSKVDGTVTQVTDDLVTITDADGKKHTYDTVKNFPFNRISSISYTATVKPGDTVKAGDMVAHSSFTDAKTGALNLGQNLRVAVLPYRGKSVAGYTNVLWQCPDGSWTYGPISDVPTGSGMKSIAMDIQTLTQHTIPVHSWMIHAPDSELVRVDTRDGTTIDATRSHSFVGWFGDGIRECTIDELQSTGALIPVVPPTLPFSDEITDVTMSTLSGNRPITVKADRNFGFVVGLYIAEGCVVFTDPAHTKPKTTAFSAVEPEIIAVLSNILNGYGINTSNKQIQQPNGTSGTVYAYASPLARWLHANCGSLAANKKLPDLVWSAHREFAEGLIDGYFSGDGTCTAKQVCASSASKRLVEGLAFLLGGLGVRATVRTYNLKDPKHQASNMLYVFREFLDKFPTITLPRKERALRALIKPIKFSRDRIPLPDSERYHINKLLGHTQSGRQSVSRNRLMGVYDGLPPITKRLVDAPIWWDVVHSVTPIPSQEYVYDLDMRPYGTFVVANGLVVHNSFEDAVVISESAAKRLSTERLYGIDADTRNGVEINKNRYISAFPDNFTKEQVDTLDSKGVVKVGTILKRGDPIVVAVGPKLLSSADAQLGRLHKVLRNSFTDKSQVWEYDYPGEVVDVAHLRSGAKVNIKAVQPVAVGDKLSTRFGLKGVVGTIVPDDEMPRNHATNEPYEMLMNPMGILSRVAPNQIMEMSLGKLARQRGEQVRIPQLRPQEGWVRWASAQLEAAGVPDASDVFDPSTGKVIKNIGDGSVYVAAFHHLADKKLSSRGEVGKYTADRQPAKGGPTGSKRFSSMNVGAALAHGSTAVIKDAITIRGTENEEFWKALRLGRPLPEPEVPFIYDKFLNTLRAGGINVVEQGDITSIMPMTDADITKMSRGSVDSSSMLDDDLNPIAGGLFDAGRTGGTAGNRWTHITLPEPVPNPVMEEPVRRVLGLTVKRLENILAGEEELDGKTGGAAIRSALSKLDPDAMINEYRDKVKTLRGSNRDNAVKVLGYLDGARKQGIHPKDWMISKVPVLPPMFRPISKLGDVALVADINELYRDLIENAEAYKELKGTLPDDALTSERLNIYKSVQAAFGLGDPITPEGQSKRIKGAIRQVIGTRPKTGLFQSKVTSKTVDVVGRGVATPNPNLSMNQVGIPERSAWEMYKDFVTRGLVRRGYDAPTALELIDKRHPTARAMLDAEMSTRPILVDRAPTWHKFNFLAFYPHIVEGDTLQVSPLIVKGFNLDFDGDQMNFHVPVSDKAVEQAKEKMLPSKNLFSLTDLKSARHTPTMEMTMGLYWLTRKANKRKKVRRFGSTSEAEKAYRKGEIGANDPIQIG